jgi:hypothetical protein
MNIEQKIREIAKNNKYTRWYISIIKNAQKLETKGYSEKHHIIPKSFNVLRDVNCADNIVKLTPKQHFICHLLLCKMFEGIFNKKMNFAFHQLKLKNRYQQGRYINSRFYSYIKKEKRQYHRLYKGNKVTYVDIGDTNKLNTLQSDGWSSSMTEEYKIGRVGNMIGKTHSSETKKRMSESAKNIDHHWLRNISKEKKQAAAKKALENRKKDPEKYNESLRRHGETLKERIRLGLVQTNKGHRNGRFGIPLSEDGKRIISEKAQRRSNEGYTLFEVYTLFIKPLVDKGYDSKYISKNLPAGINKTPFNVRTLITKFSE